MIRTEREYQAARQELRQADERADTYRRSLQQEGLDPAAVKRLTDPSVSFNKDLADEVREYEKLRAGIVEPVAFAAIGRFLVGLRIAKGWSQRDLARALGVNESVVSRDERNEYHGVTTERAQKIFDALGEHVTVGPASVQPVQYRRLD
jgi:hypothetical protein